MITDNKTVYSTVEFDSWAKREGLIRSESFLIENYFDSNPIQDTVEAGTAGGRILFDLKRRGFSNLSGFDFVPEFIEQAKKSDSNGKIHFQVMDATRLTYPDGKFSQAIYLQQIVSFLESEEGRKKAVTEAYRILRPGGTVAFSFLCFESRQSALSYRVFIAWICFLRTLLMKKRSFQLLPWLKLGGSLNWKAFFDIPPYVYWFRVEEAESLLIDAGFRIVALGTDEQIIHKNMFASAASLRDQPKKGMLYFVCKK